MRVVGWPQLSDCRAEIFLQGPQVDSDEDSISAYRPSLRGARMDYSTIDYRCCLNMVETGTSEIVGDSGRGFEGAATVPSTSNANSDDAPEVL